MQKFLFKKIALLLIIFTLNLTRNLSIFVRQKIAMYFIQDKKSKFVTHPLKNPAKNLPDIPQIAFLISFGNFS